MKSATRHTLLVVGMLGLWASAFAAGHDPGRDDKRMGMGMDTDGDGKVSAAEHAAGAKQRFTRLDADGDGFVTAAEMDTMHEARGGGPGPGMAGSAADRIKMMDTDGDGKLSAAEHAAGAEKMFRRNDSNGDGTVDAAEMKAAHPDHHGMRK